MTYPEILLLPAMMFADYYLTLLGATWREKEYARHFQTRHYELNPVWQKAIAQKKWFNPRHAARALIASALLALPFEFGVLPEPFVRGCLGCVFTVYGTILGRHLGNLLIFRYAIRRQDEVWGKVVMAPPFVTAVSLFGNVQTLIPIMLIAIFTENPFAYGSAIGGFCLIVVHFWWHLGARKKRPPSGGPAEPAVQPQAEPDLPREGSDG